MNRIFTSKFFAAAILLSFALALSGACFGQTVTTGDISGSVTDPSGAVISGASVSILSLAEGATQATTANSSGLYRFSFLKPGQYKLTVNAKGFRSVAQTVAVGVGQIAAINVRLELGAASEILEVSGAAPLIQTENADVSNSYGQQQIDVLPAPGGDITSYAYTSPGVVVSNGAGYGNFSSYGLPSTANLFTVNGNDYMDPYLNLNNSGASNLTLGSNELQEISVVENGYTVDYGRQAGAQLNAVTKSGTNVLHGNARYGYNGTALNANDWFTNAFGQSRPHAVNNTYATSLGGPIVKNKLFFFADYEGLRMILPGVSGVVTIPTPAFANYVLGNVPAAEKPFYNSIFNLYAGAPGASTATPVLGGGCGDLSASAFAGPCAANFNSNANNLITEWIFAGSIDYDVSGNDHLKGRYQMDRGVQATGTDPINSVFNATSIQPEYNGQITETHAFNSTAINNLIVSGAWYKALFGPPSFSKAIATFPTTLNFGGGASAFSPLGGADNAYPQGRIVTQYQIRDNFSKIVGPHDVKIGVDYRRNLVSDYTALSGTSGLLSINSNTEFANGVTGPATGSFYSAQFTNLGAVKIKLYNIGAYLQDQWKVTSKLSLTLGGRVDRTSNPSCATNCFARMQGPFASITHDVNTPYDATIRTGLKNAFPDVEKAVFSPRFGLAYAVTTNTVIRGGFAIADDLFPALAVDRFITNAPNVSTFGSSGASGESLAPGPGSVFADAASSNAAFQSSYASGLTLAGLGGPPLGPNYFTMGNKLFSPKFAEWNLEVQRQLGTKYSLSVNYVGNHGYDVMTVNTWLNAYCAACAPGQTFGGVIGTTPTDPRFDEIVDLTNNGFSNYNGLTTTLKMKPTKGFSGQFSYTWSHDLDTCSNNCLEPFVANTLVSLRYQPSPLLPGSSYGNSDYDVRHNFNVNYVYETPHNWSNSIMNRVVGGWTIGGVLYYHTGLPWSPVDSVKRSELANVRGLRTTTPLATFSASGQSIIGSSCGRNAAKAGAGTGGAPCATISQFNVGSLDFGNSRNAMRGPGFFNTDLSLTKEIKFGERVGFAFGATAFDILNHQNFDLPVNSIKSPAFGQIQSTIGSNTNPYGAFFGVPLNGRILQVNAKLTF